jgi:hypothetical protein
MRLTFAWVVAGALLAGGPSSAAGQQGCRAVVGHFRASLVLPGQGHCPADAEFCTAGRVWGGTQGTYHIQLGMLRGKPAA